MKLGVSSAFASRTPDCSLARFYREVLRAGGPALVVGSLSDLWLDVLTAEASDYLRQRRGEPSCFLALAVTTLFEFGAVADARYARCLRERTLEYIGQLFGEGIRRAREQASASQLTAT